MRVLWLYFTAPLNVAHAVQQFVVAAAVSLLVASFGYLFTRLLMKYGRK